MYWAFLTFSHHFCDSYNDFDTFSPFSRFSPSPPAWLLPGSWWALEACRGQPGPWCPGWPLVGPRGQKGPGRRRKRKRRKRRKSIKIIVTVTKMMRKSPKRLIHSTLLFQNEGNVNDIQYFWLKKCRMYCAFFTFSHQELRMVFMNRKWRTLFDFMDRQKSRKKRGKH